MPPRVLPHRTDCERGAILLVVLVLTVTFAVLSMALLATAEMSLRVQSNGRDLERAERAAQSGVEWAAAVVKANGLVDAARATVLTPGVTVATQIRSATAPQLLGGGSAYGVEARYGAEATVTAGPQPHALLVYAGQLQSNDDITIAGPAYFGEPTAPLALGGRGITIDGDLQLVATMAPAGVTHTSGANLFGVASLTEPVWNTVRFSLLSGWTATTHVYNGSTTISKTTLNGIVVVNMAGGQTLSLEEVTINGTLVVPWIYPPLLESLGVPKIELKGKVTINGGTADTGNLALLAPTSRLVGDRQGVTAITGVAYVRTVEDFGSFSLRGQLLVRKGISSNTNNTATIGRPAGFVPTVPYGITWNGPSTVRLAWRGKS